MEAWRCTGVVLLVNRCAVVALLVNRCAVVALLVTLCSAASHISDSEADAAALLSIRDQVAGKRNPVFASWIGSNPCVWEGITCSDYRIVSLNLTNKGLKGVFPSELGNLTRLETLVLAGNEITGPISPSFSSLSSLKILDLSGNPLSGEFPEPILEIKSLVDVRLGQCNLTGPFPNIRKLPLLHKFNMNSNNFTGDLPDLEDLPLAELSFWGTKLGSDWRKIGALRNLTMLSLHSCGLEGSLPVEWGINLRKLKSIFMNNNNLTGEIPDSWSEMKNLTELRLDVNKLTGNIPLWFSASHFNPQNVFLFCNFFSGKPPQGYPTMNIKGNCFEDGSLQDHDHGSECTDGICQYKSKNKKTAAAIGGAAGCSFLALVVQFWKCRRSKGIVYKDEETGKLKSWEAPPGVEKFPLNQITKATRRFSKDCEIGHGGFGKVYRGKFKDGRVLAIKKADVAGGQGRDEFLNEIMLLSRLHHRNLVPLVGFCYHPKHQLLVYELMENGNLHQWLLGKHSEKCLDWYQRLDIATGVAQGLEYLHSFADPPVIHRDLKPANILLDGSLVARISDFGISKVSIDTHVSTGPAGTAGYLDPEYFLRRQLTTASDVYSFGVVLLELITGQRAVDRKRTEEVNLIEWVKPRLASEGVRAIVDERLGDDYPKAVFKVLAKLALDCVSVDRSKRPSTMAVVATLTDLMKRHEDT